MLALLRNLFWSIVLCVGGNAALAAPGELDPTFGSGGMVVTSVGPGSDSASSVAVQSNGKFVVAGSARIGSRRAFALLRYNPDGTLDTSLDGSGKVTTFVGNYDGAGSAVAIQPDGKILLAGTAYNEAGSVGKFAVVRYLANGSLDASFGSKGKVETLVNTSSYASSVALQADGKIVVAGSAAGTNGYDIFALARYNADGTLDSTFNGSGKVAVSFGDRGSVIRGLAIQSDGKVVAVGESYLSGSAEFGLMRFLSDGSLDASFGTGGKVSLNIGSDSGVSVGLQSNGRIVVLGSSHLLRFTTAGVLDSTFGTSGQTTLAITQGQAVNVQGDGRIVITGFQLEANTHIIFAVARYQADGILDTSFGSGGKSATAVSHYSNWGYGAALQSDGKIIAVGYADQGSKESIAVVRYTSSGALDTTFGGGGATVTDLGGNDGANGVAVQSDGAIVALGTDTTSSGSVLVRYLANGRLDSTYGTGGKANIAFKGNRVAVQTDGKAIVAGASLARYTSAGQLDSTFGAGGQVSLSGFTAKGLAVQSNGRIVLVGGTENNMTLARYTATGAPDATFGTSGKITTSSGISPDAGVVLQVDGKIIVGGLLDDGTKNVFAAARYTAVGALDTAYGTGGKASFDVGSGYIQSCRGLELDAQGRALLVGYLYDYDGNTILKLARLTTTGKHDTNFGIDALVSTRFGSGHSYVQAYAVAARPDGRILVAGEVLDGGWAFALYRFSSYGDLDTGFGTAGVSSTHVGNGDVAQALAVQSDGNIIAVGSVTKDSKDLVIARYLGAGQVGGILSTGDAPSHGLSGRLSDYYTLSGSGSTTITLTSGFNNALYLYDSDLNLIASDGDSYGTTASSISAFLSDGDTYYLEASSYSTGARGSYSLTAASGQPYPTSNPWVPPTVATDPATDITSTSAVLNATVGPSRIPVHIGIFLDGGTSEAGAVDVPPLTETTKVSCTVTGLASGSYHTFYAADKVHSVTGATRSFTTLYAVTPTAGDHGTISPATPQSVPAGGSVSFTAAPVAGRVTYQWIVNGQTRQTGGNTLTVSNITQSTSVVATFLEVRPILFDSYPAASSNPKVITYQSSDGSYGGIIYTRRNPRGEVIGVDRVVVGKLQAGSQNLQDAIEVVLDRHGYPSYFYSQNFGHYSLHRRSDGYMSVVGKDASQRRVSQRVTGYQSALDGISAELSQAIASQFNFGAGTDAAASSASRLIGITSRLAGTVLDILGVAAGGATPLGAFEALKVILDLADLYCYLHGAEPSSPVVKFLLLTVTDIKVTGDVREMEELLTLSRKALRTNWAKMLRIGLGLFTEVVAKVTDAYDKQYGGGDGDVGGTDVHVRDYILPQYRDSTDYDGEALQIMVGYDRVKSVGFGYLSVDYNHSTGVYRVSIDWMITDQRGFLAQPSGEFTFSASPGAAVSTTIPCGDLGSTATISLTPDAAGYTGNVTLKSVFKVIDGLGHSQLRTVTTTHAETLR